MKDHEWLLKILIAEYGGIVNEKQQELEQLRDEYHRAVIIHEARRHYGKDEPDGALVAAREKAKQAAVALKNAEETHQALTLFSEALRQGGRLLTDVKELLDRVA